MAPNNRVVNHLFGVTTGMAMGILTFDWGQISYNGSPLSVPWWVAANGGFTIVIFYWITTPILYVRCSVFCSAPTVTFSLLYGSTRTSGTPLTFLWCPHAPSITPAKSTTFPESSTMTHRSTSRLTRLTVLYSSRPPSPSHTDLDLRRSPPHLPTPSSITANKFGLTPAVRFHNNLMSMLASCRRTGRSPIGGI